MRRACAWHGGAAHHQSHAGTHACPWWRRVARGALAWGDEGKRQRHAWDSLITAENRTALSLAANPALWAPSRCVRAELPQPPSGQWQASQRPASLHRSAGSSGLHAVPEFQRGLGTTAAGSQTRGRLRRSQRRSTLSRCASTGGGRGSGGSTRSLATRHLRANRFELRPVIRLASMGGDLDQWIARVQNGEYLQEDELKSLCDLVRLHSSGGPHWQKAWLP